MTCLAPSKPPSSAIAVGAVGLLTAGMAAAGLGYGIFGPPRDAGLVEPLLWPPRWLFWAIWVVLYPVTGIAGAWLWQARATPAGARAWRWFVVGMATALLWVPVVQASGDELVAPVLMDIVSGLAGLAALAAARRASRRAFLWLLPINAWGLVTTILKVWRLVLNL